MIAMNVNTSEEEEEKEEERRRGIARPQAQHFLEDIMPTMKFYQNEICWDSSSFSYFCCRLLLCGFTVLLSALS